MAGFSIILLLMFFFWPLMLVYALFSIVAVAAAEFVTSAAFPCLIGAIILSTLAAADVIRILWRHYHERDAFPLRKELFIRPLVLVLLAFALFVAMCVICGSMILTWFNTSVQS